MGRTSHHVEARSALGGARILLFSRRAFDKSIPNSLLYELEEVIHQVDDVDLLAPHGAVSCGPPPNVGKASDVVD